MDGMGGMGFFSSCFLPLWLDIPSLLVGSHGLDGGFFLSRWDRGSVVEVGMNAKQNNFLNVWFSL